MESAGKYEENETNRDLLRSTVQKLFHLDFHCKSEFELFFLSKWVTFEPLIVEGCGWSHFLCLFEEIPFPIHFLKIDSQGAPYDPNNVVGI
jgi:hypothetical protein